MSKKALKTPATSQETLCTKTSMRKSGKVETKLKDYRNYIKNENGARKAEILRDE